MRAISGRAMRRRAAALLCAAALAGAAAACGGDSAPSADADSYEVETVAWGLSVPWDLAFAPDGRIFVTERPGRVRVILDGVLQEEPVARIDVWAQSEAGLMGIALDPAFADNGLIYVCYTAIDPDRGPVNRVARLTEGGAPEVILDGIPAARNHNGCRIRFGPDRALYVTMGDAQDAAAAQDRASLSGKALRINPDGSIPADNPFPGSPVYALGLRNPQGIAWHPDTGDAFLTEHGPADNDEVNLLIAGSNYGWPEVKGTAGDPRYTDPLITYTPTVALAGADIYPGGPLPLHWTNSLFFATLKEQRLHRLTLVQSEDGAWAVAGDETLLEREYGRLRAVAAGPDGALYVTTSNRDGRGRPGRLDDRVLRIVPAGG